MEVVVSVRKVDALKIIANAFKKDRVASLIANAQTVAIIYDSFVDYSLFISDLPYEDYLR